MSEQEKYWFKAKKYGWGWSTPLVWQGWAVYVGHFLLIMIAGVVLLRDAPEDELSPEVIYFMIWVFAQSLLLFYIARKKGPKPRWRWGEDDEK